MNPLKFISDQDFRENGTLLSRAEYDNCRFTNGRFAETDLSNFVFSTCSFTVCDLSLAQLVKTAFRDVTFTNCKLLGLRFDLCDDFLFSVTFNNCNLNLCSFYGRKIKGTTFNACSLHETDFTLADVSSASFTDCDLSGAIFEQTKMDKADLRRARNFIIEPEKNSIKRARFELDGLPGLLSGYDIRIG